MVYLPGPDRIKDLQHREVVYHPGIRFNPGQTENKLCFESPLLSWVSFNYLQTKSISTGIVFPDSLYRVDRQFRLQ